MNRSSIELKSSKYVLTLMMDPDASFAQILNDTAQKFRSSAPFFRGAKMGLELHGRDLTPEEQTEIVRVITENCPLDITCLVEEDADKEQKQYEAIARTLQTREAEAMEQAVMIAGTMKNGRKFASDRSILLLGDLEPAAELSSKGSILVLGIAMGILKAGTGGREDTFIAANVLKPSVLEICGRRSVSAIRKKTLDDSYPVHPQVCMLEDGHLKTETISGKTWDHIFAVFRNHRADGSSPEANA